MTEALVVDLPEDWFAKAQRALADLQFKTERRMRELALRDQEIERRAREVAEKAEQMREAFRRAEETSQDLMARTHALRDQEAALAAGREELEASRRAVDERADAVAVREASLADLQRQLKEREETVIRALAEVEVLRAQSRAAAPVSGPVDEREAVGRLLELRETVEATAQRLHLREGQAEQLLGEAMERAEEMHRIEAEVRAREARLDGLRVEIVNAKRALETVDEALTRMPYEIVDDFTKSGAFDAYENAVRILKRFADGPTA